MTTRRSQRPPRSRKASATDTMQTSAPAVSLDVPLTASSAPPPLDPTQTAQLRALEAGWDDLLT